MMLKVWDAIMDRLNPIVERLPWPLDVIFALVFLVSVSTVLVGVWVLFWGLVYDV